MEKETPEINISAENIIELNIENTRIVKKTDSYLDSFTDENTKIEENEIFISFCIEVIEKNIKYYYLVEIDKEINEKGESIVNFYKFKQSTEKKQGTIEKNNAFINQSKGYKKLENIRNILEMELANVIFKGEYYFIEDLPEEDIFNYYGYENKEQKEKIKRAIYMKVYKEAELEGDIKKPNIKKKAEKIYKQTLNNILERKKREKEIKNKYKKRKYLNNQ